MKKTLNTRISEYQLQYFAKNKTLDVIFVVIEMTTAHADKNAIMIDQCRAWTTQCDMNIVREKI